MKKLKKYEVRGWYTRVESVYGIIEATSRKAAEKIVMDMRSDDVRLRFETQDGDFCVNVEKEIK